MHFSVFLAPVSFLRCSTDEITQQFSTSAKIRTPCFISHHSRNCNLILLHLSALIHQQSFALTKKKKTLTGDLSALMFPSWHFTPKQSDIDDFRCTAIKALPFIHLLMLSSEACKNTLLVEGKLKIRGSAPTQCLCFLLLFL